MMASKVRRSNKSLTGIPDGDNTENGGEAVLKRHQPSDSGTITILQGFFFATFELECGNIGDIGEVGSILGSGRSPGGGHGNPLQYSSWEVP